MGYKHNDKCYCKNIEQIENYEKAKADNFKGWCIHHRLETHNSDGERRLVDIAVKELIALNMYFNRPAEELIFMTIKEHRVLHTKGKLGTNNKGKPGTFRGKHHTEESKKKISTAKKGKHPSEETKRKMSITRKGRTPWNKGKTCSKEVRKKISATMKEKHWFHNGKVCVRCCECPEGFTPGRLRK